MVTVLTKAWMRRSILTVALLFLLSTPQFTHCFPNRSSSRPSPVILVPGDGGSQLEAKLDKPEVVHYYCNKKTDDYFSLWLNLELLFPYVLDCWVDNMKLLYDNVTRKTSNSPGVDIRVPGFGNTTSVEWLDPSQISPSSYFNAIVETLITLGFKRGIDVRGAPYDYRKAPNEMDAYFKRLAAMTENMYDENSETKVIFICHSMGCPILLYFFNHQSQVWKDKYVNALISLGGAWGGAVKAFKAFASGENLGVFVINHLAVRTEQRTCPSLAYMLPFDTFWNSSEVLVQTSKKNYTIANLNEFFNDIEFPIGYEMWKDTHDLTRSLTAPGVEIHCVHGVKEDTIERLIYKENEFPDSNPSVVYGDGDGTVNLRSLEGCLRFKGNQKQKVYHIPLSNVDHMGILSNGKVLSYLKGVVSAF